MRSIETLSCDSLLTIPRHPLRTVFATKKSAYYNNYFSFFPYNRINIYNVSYFCLYDKKELTQGCPKDVLDNAGPAGQCKTCWTMQDLLDNARHAGQCRTCWTMQDMLDNAGRAGQCKTCWTMQYMLDNARHAGQCKTCWTMQDMLDNARHAGQCMAMQGNAGHCRT